MPIVDVISLQETAQKQYLTYALSVITSRALPDIRDGLKPVHRRILYAMFQNLRLLPEGRYRKSATVVGEVMGKYHPHGDTAIYDSMVRMAQAFSLRYPVVDGQGNFGSIDGDSAAAMRYTEAKLRPLAVALLSEIRQQTVPFRPNYDGTIFEPVVLPAQFPSLLVNGSSGIAVGMATNIPPHNFTEVIDAAILLSKGSASVEKLVEIVKGPDFPTAGRILNTAAELQKIYETGEGPVELRAEYRTGKLDDGKRGIILYSIPYGQTKSDLVEKIADHVRAGRLPQITDVRDESTDEIRVVLEMRRGADPEKAMAYLFKHTALQTRFHVNLTALVPTEKPDVCVPRRVNLKEAIQYFLDFRYEVVVKRLRNELEQLEKRIHILKGFAIIFDALDEAIRIIRSSQNKADAAQRLMHRFRLDELQTDAILEIKLYRLAQLEMLEILKELEEKEARAAEIRTLLADDTALWKLVRGELREVRKEFGDERRTTIAGPDKAHGYTEEDYILKEDVYVIVTRDGWVKRQRSYSELGAIRIREGDQIGWVLPGSTRSAVCFFTSLGKAYTIRVDQLSQTTGYGDPIQKLFSFADRETVVGVISLDDRLLPGPLPIADPEMDLFAENVESEAGPFITAISSDGFGVRAEVSNFSDPSTRAGRTFMKVGTGETVLSVELSRGNENVCLATHEGRGLIFPVTQIPVFKSAARGVIAMRLDAKDYLVGFALSSSARKGLIVETNRGRQEIVRPTKFDVSNRGNKGRVIVSRGTLKYVTPEPIEITLNGDEKPKNQHNDDELDGTE